VVSGSHDWRRGLPSDARSAGSKTSKRPIGTRLAARQGLAIPGKGKGPGLPDTNHRDAQTAKAQIKLWRSLSHGLKGLLPRVFLGALKARQCGGPHLINGDSNADPAALPMCRDRFRPRRFKSQKQKQMRAGEALKQKSGVANPGTFSTWIPLDSLRIVLILASLFRLPRNPVLWRLAYGAL